LLFYFLNIRRGDPRGRPITALRRIILGYLPAFGSAARAAPTPSQISRKKEAVIFQIHRKTAGINCAAYIHIFHSAKILNNLVLRNDV